MKLSSAPNTSVQQVPQAPILKLIPTYSVNPLFLLPQIRINKMANQNIDNYHPSHSGLTLSIHPLIFL